MPDGGHPIVRNPPFDRPTTIRNYFRVTIAIIRLNYPVIVLKMDGHHLAI
jgi:hypothetical protein